MPANELVVQAGGGKRPMPPRVVWTLEDRTPARANLSPQGVPFYMSCGDIRREGTVGTKVLVDQPLHYEGIPRLEMEWDMGAEAQK